jgi:energy-coupling factor transporter ATP-binding protein EcfA2
MIIGLAGSKQSGKSTTCNILHGIVLKERGMISDYSIGNEGQLLIKTPELTEWSVFDITRQDEEFVVFAEKEMWPYVKSYSFADPLKTIATELFNIPHKNVYGTNKDKNQKIRHLLWKNMPGANPYISGESLIANKVEYQIHNRDSESPWCMTAREFMQYFGTDIMRKIWEPVWCSGTINKIVKEDSQLAIIADVRFPNEVQSVKDKNGHVYWMQRSVFEDTHASEVTLLPENYDHANFDGTLINEGKGKTLNALRKSVEKLYKELRTKSYIK